MYKFSVIIPTYNRADLLDKCLQSLAEQTFKDFEVLVCDDGSMDNSKEIAEKYLDTLNITYIWNENWGGPARPRNIGIQASQGEWICLLDSDDWWTPNKLEACLPYLEDYDMLYHDMQVYDQDKGVSETIIKCRMPKSPFFVDLLKFGNCCPNSSVVLRKSIVDKVGLISEEKELVAVEDFDFWLRTSQVTERFFLIPKVLGYYWVGQTSISSSPKWFARHEALYEKHLPLLANPKQRKQVKAWQQYRVALEYSKLGEHKKARNYYCKALSINRLRSKLKISHLIILGLFKKQS